jgi:hypothetical protein
VVDSLGATRLALRLPRMGPRRRMKGRQVERDGDDGADPQPPRLACHLPLLRGRRRGGGRDV